MSSQSAPLEWRQKRTALRWMCRHCYLALLLLYCAVPFHAQADSTVSAAPTCLKQARNPAQHAFQDLTGVNVYVLIPAQYQEAIDCHGIEESCVKHAGGYGSNTFNSAEYIRMLKDNYASYPKPLFPSALEGLLVPRVQRGLGRFVTPDDRCNIPNVKVLHRANLFKYAPTSPTGLEPVFTPHVVTITVTVQLFANVQPRVATLSTTIFRPDCHNATFDDSLAHVTALPIDGPEESITNALTEYFSHLPAVRVMVHGQGVE